MAVEPSTTGALRETMREPVRDMARESYPAAELFQKAHARMVMLHRLDEQLIVLAEQRRKHEQELSVIQAQINAEFNRALRPATERNSTGPERAAADAPSTRQAPAPAREAQGTASSETASKPRKKSDKTMALAATSLTPNIDPAWLRPQAEPQPAALDDEDDD